MVEIDDGENVPGDTPKLTENTDKVSCGRCEKTHVYTQEAQEVWKFEEGVDVVLAKLIDWAAIYIDGELVCQNHSAQFEAVLDKLEGEKIGTFREFQVQSWFSENRPGGAYLPSHLDDYPDNVIPN